MTTPSEAAPLDGDLEDFRAALADQYTIERELGRGGHSLVFLAHDRQNRRQVAIKILRPELALHVATERFLREIEITAQLQHPHILALFSSGSAAGHTYYVMPYIEGESLDAYLARTGPLPVDEAVRLAGEVAEALQYAHAKGFVHRDIKPGNILLSEGHALVADFGIARALRVAGDSTITGEGTVIGTAAYISPEQAGAADTLDARSDQYALACVVYEMLAGQPPFSGPSLQAVIARHLAEPPPPLRVVRPAVTPALQAVIERGLAKVPGDRWATVGEFAAALKTSLLATHQPPVQPAPNIPRWAVIATVAAAGLVGLAIWKIGFAGGPPLDPNAVVVFPLVQTPAGANRGDDGWQVAIAIGTAFEHTEPLKWIDGWTWMTAEQRQDLTQLTAANERRIARDRGARWFVEGTVAHHGDFATVVLRLMDARGDSLVARESAAGHASQAAQAGWRAVTKLLPRLLAPGREIDLSILLDRHPGAVASWLQGEREYRRSHFGPALQFYRRAVQEDSSLAVAALRGAEAADWEETHAEALQLVDVALARLDLLPPKYAAFARGLRAYFVGDADSALAHFQDALTADPLWSGAWMAKGEVYYHLLPDVDRPDSLAKAAFLASHDLDPGFAPPIFHLTEIALRTRDLNTAASQIAAFRAVAPDSLWLVELELMDDCVRNGPEHADWERAARHPRQLMTAAKALAAEPGHLACAEREFETILSADSTTSSEMWGALAGLTALLVGTNRAERARVVLDSALGAGMMAAYGFYVDAALAGVPMEPRASEAIGMLGHDYGVMRSSWLWFCGRWAAHQNRLSTLDTITAIMQRRATDGADPRTTVWAAALSAYLALARGDTISAVGSFAAVRTAAPRGQVAWGSWESFAAERLQLAALLLAVGKGRDALQTAERTDHPWPISFLMYRRSSLALRERIAAQIGRRDLADLYRRRRSALEATRVAAALEPTATRRENQ